MNPFYLIAILNMVLSALSQTLLKKSALRTYDTKWREYVNPYVIGGYAMLGLAMLLALICYNRIGYLTTVVLEPGGYILVLLIGWRVFREKITPRKLCGMALIVIGMVWFSL